MVDLHTHLIPGVDDGARNVGEARQALRALADAGVSRVLATPHVDASTLAEPESREKRLRALDAGWERLREAVGESGSPDSPALGRGVELRLDAPLPDLSDPRLRLAGTDAVLVEFQSLEAPPFGARQLSEVSGAGLLPVLAHPERYRGLERRPELAREWRQAGAVLQLNAGSLVGQYGDAVKGAAWELLRRGWADVLSSDYHARGTLHLDGARRALAKRDGGEAVRLLLDANPTRVLSGRRAIPVTPPEGRGGWWRRLRRWLGL